MAGTTRTLDKTRELWGIILDTEPLWEMGRDCPLPTKTRSLPAYTVDTSKLSGLFVMWEVAPESRNHSWLLKSWTVYRKGFSYVSGLFLFKFQEIPAAFG
jgi:hypothetical protein